MFAGRRDDWAVGKSLQGWRGGRVEMHRGSLSALAATWGLAEPGVAILDVWGGALPLEGPWAPRLVEAGSWLAPSPGK